MAFENEVLDNFTTSTPVNKAILGLSIIRLIIFFLIFLLNLNQSLREFIAAKKRKVYFTNARLITYLSITIYPLIRTAMIGEFLGYDKTIYRGSIMACMSIWATMFQYFEWVFIACYWMSLLYTFFLSKDYVKTNTKIVWVTSWVLVVILVIWTIVQTIFNFYNLPLMDRTYGIGQVILIVSIGLFYFINGVLLIVEMKKKGSVKSFQKGYKRIIKLSFALLLLVFGALFMFVIQVLVLKMNGHETANYIFYLIASLIEFTQLPIVMYSLGGDSFRRYIILYNQKLPETSKSEFYSGVSSSTVDSVYSSDVSYVDNSIKLKELPIQKSTESSVISNISASDNNLSTNTNGSNLDSSENSV
ncbi:hypothetical protein RB653_000570 [Dictyostelium firmibasis]|uniref:Uncharacterized protein n=1 Tax=Dictyostelium firmibasis TaxID=79012 RepID=A0AAN7Z1A1_9MYCE